MGSEAPVLDGNHRLRKIGRKLLEPDRFASRVAPIGHQGAVGGHDAHIGRALGNPPFGGGGKPCSIIGEHADEADAAPDAKHETPVEQAPQSTHETAPTGSASPPGTGAALAPTRGRGLAPRALLLSRALGGAFVAVGLAAGGLATLLARRRTGLAGPVRARQTHVERRAATVEARLAPSATGRSSGHCLRVPVSVRARPAFPFRIPSSSLNAAI